MATNKFIIYQQHHQRENEKFRKKLRRLKRTIKNTIYENAALCDQVAQIQENIMCTKEERRFLLKKLIEYENEMDSQLYGSIGAPTIINSSNHQFNEFSSTPVKKISIKKRSNSEANSEASFKGRGFGIPANKKPLTAGKTMKNPPQATQNIMLPISLPEFVLHAIGDVVCDRPGYHSETCIYPVGYKIARMDANFKDPDLKCTYTCQIIDNGDNPRFEIFADVDSEFVISGPSPDYCHTTLLQVIHSATDTRNTNIRPRGEWFFGLQDSVVTNLIQSHANAYRCVNFKGFAAESVHSGELESETSMNFEALQKHLTIAAYHTVPEIKEEPPDELLDHSDLNNFQM